MDWQGKYIGRRDCGIDGIYKSLHQAHLGHTIADHSIDGGLIRCQGILLPSQRVQKFTTDGAIGCVELNRLECLACNSKGKEKRKYFFWNRTWVPPELGFL